MSLTTLLAAWRDSPRFMANVTAWEVLPAHPPRYAAWPSHLDPRLVQALRASGVAQLYTHQAAALEATQRGEHVVVVTATASGKTLCYNLPVLNTLLNNPDARALYLFPTKALAQDQAHALRQMIEALAGYSGDLRDIRAATYDGDTPQGVRKNIRDIAQVLISNPDMLHAGILPHHTRWQKFFAGLRYVVLDELHTYRGVFGSHVANLLRRLRRICHFYGSSPQFICASATIANPRQLAEGLLEAPVTLVAQDGAPRARKHIIFFNPPIVDRQLGRRRGTVLTASDIVQELLEHDVQSIAFARSRLTTEILLVYLRDFVRGQGWPPDTVSGYRGGYLPDERRAIEKGLRDGNVKVATATNALECGIDLGELGACVLVGYPGTIASTWQQFGRAGRRSRESAAFLVAGSGALDQYLITHPRYFFERTPEHARIAPDNLAIVLAHLQCAVFELPFQEEEFFGNFPDTAEVLKYLEEQAVLYRAAGSWYWMSERYPAERVSLRSATTDNFVIATMDEIEGPQVIGELDRPSVPLLVYPGAIYLHQGVTYQVTALDWEGGRVEVRPVEVDHYTQASITTEVKVLEVYEEASAGATTKAHGRVLVTSHATGYRIIKRYSHETLGWGEIDLPEQTMETTAYWLSLTGETLDRMREIELWRFDRVPYYGSDWPAQRDAARARDRYRCRYCNAPERPGRCHDVHHLKPIREFLTQLPPAQAYQQANQLSNLITLCHSCHRRAEAAQRTSNAWRGLANALANLAPLFLMCDPVDIGVTQETQPRGGLPPAITIYDQVPEGLGFSEQLYELHDTLLDAARELVADCPCVSGCPACVGPTITEEEDSKAETLTLLRILLHTDIVALSDTKPGSA
jgi:DEAD/DEAH box helicase domain-containing protein